MKLPRERQVSLDQRSQPATLELAEIVRRDHAFERVDWLIRHWARTASTTTRRRAYCGCLRTRKNNDESDFAGVDNEARVFRHRVVESPPGDVGFVRLPIDALDAIRSCSLADALDQRSADAAPAF